MSSRSADLTLILGEPISPRTDGHQMQHTPLLRGQGGVCAPGQDECACNGKCAVVRWYDAHCSLPVIPARHHHWKVSAHNILCAVLSVTFRVWVVPFNGLTQVVCLLELWNE